MKKTVTPAEEGNNDDMFSFFRNLAVSFFYTSSRQFEIAVANTVDDFFDDGWEYFDLTGTRADLHHRVDGLFRHRETREEIRVDLCLDARAKIQRVRLEGLKDAYRTRTDAIIDARMFEAYADGKITLTEMLRYGQALWKCI